MSIAVLNPIDTARSGCYFSQLLPALSANGTYFHPFRWHDNYWRPASLPAELEEKALAALTEYVTALENPLAAFDKKQRAIETYYDIVTRCVNTVLDAPPEEFQDVFVDLTSRARLEAMYNLGVLWFRRGCQGLSLFSDGVQWLTEASGIFNKLLKAPFWVESDRMEVSKGNLRIMATLALATAFETSYAYYFKDTVHQPDANADLAHQASFYFTMVTALTEENLSVPDRAALANYSNIKRQFYEGSAFYALSLESDTNKGDSRRRRAATAFESALQHVLRFLPGDRGAVEAECQWFLDRCHNFKKLQRKGAIAEAVLSNHPRRSAQYSTLYPRQPKPTPPSRLENALQGELIVSGDSVQVQDSIVGSSTASKENAQQKLAVSAILVDTDLRLRSETTLISENSTRYQVVEGLLSLKAPQVGPSVSSVAVVYILDINYPEEHQRKIWRDLVCLSLHNASLTAADRVGLVNFGSDGVATACTLEPATEETINTISVSIQKQTGRGKFEASRGTNLVSAVKVAVESLAAASAGTKEIVLISDGGDNTAFSDLHAWGDLATLKPLLETHRFPVHCFGLAAADMDLLAGLSGRTRGTHTIFRPITNADRAEEATSALRRFLVLVQNQMKTRLAERVQATITCAKGILLAAVTPSIETAVTNASLSSAQTSATVSLPPLSAGDETDVLITFAVPTEMSKLDVVPLAQVDVTYDTPSPSSASPSHRITESVRFTNKSCIRLVDRETQGYLLTLKVEEQTASCTLTTSSDKTYPLLGGESVCQLDRVQTESNASLTLCAVEGSKIELEGRSTARFEIIARNEIHLVASGTVYVMTARDFTVRVKFDRYDVLVQSDSAVKLSIEEGIFRACTILGACHITSEGKQTPLALTSPKQTSARVPDAPVTPWAVTDDVFKSWVDRGNATSKRITDLMAIQTEKCRLKAAAVLTRVARYALRAIRSGTLSQSKALKRCRVFFMLHLLGQAKAFILNSIAYATTNPPLERLRLELEAALKIAAPENRWTLSLEEVLVLRDMAEATAQKRSQVRSALYELSTFVQHLQKLLNERDRLVMLAALAKQAEEREALDQEARRRREMIGSLLPLWDFEAHNSLSTHEIQTIFFSLPIDSSDALRTIVTRWHQLMEAVGEGKSYRYDQVVAILEFCASTLEAFEFNTSFEKISELVQRAAREIDETRLSRTIYCVFRRFDSQRLGALRWVDIVQTLSEVFGENAATFRRIEAFATESITTMRQLTKDSLTTEDFPQQPLTVIPFLKGMSRFLLESGAENATNSVLERNSQQQLLQIFKLLEQRTKYPNDIQLVMLRERKKKELAHLQEWELRHIFNGLTRKEIEKLTAGEWEPPTFIHRISHPFCVLLGLVKQSNVDFAVKALPTDDDSWNVLKRLLRRDSVGFTEFLQSFPILSVSHKQAQRLAEDLKEPQLDASNLLKVSPVLSSLVGWLRLVLRMAFLLHDFEVPQLTEDHVISKALAAQHSMEPLMKIPAIQGPPPVTPNIQRKSEQLSYFFKPVFGAAPKIGKGEVTRFGYAARPSTASLQVHRSIASHNSEDAKGPQKPSRPSTANANPKRVFVLKRPLSAKGSHDSQVEM